MTDLYSASSNLGDNLSLVPTMRATPCRVHLFDDPANRSVAPIFDGLGEVLFDNPMPPKASPEAAVIGPHSQKLLVAHGFLDADPIPCITVNAEEIEQARAVLGDVKNPCVLKANPAKLNYRTPPLGLMRDIVRLNPGVTFLNFGLNSHHAKHDFAHVAVDGVRNIFNLPIRIQAACYHLIGRYVGPDTGDQHLMLSVGGHCDVFVPPSAWHYNHDDFHYGPSCWLNKPARAKYMQWDRTLGPSLCGLRHP